jgi:hypothetical protein
MSTNFAPSADLDAPIVAIYACDDERYLVSLVVSYAIEDARCPEEAIELAVGLITDLGSADTVWCVLDRETGVRHLIEQGDALSEWPSGDVVHVHRAAGE